MRTILKLSAAAALVAATPAFAEGVLVIDLGRVLSDSAAAKSGTAQLRAKYDAQITQRQTALNTAAQSYQTQLNAARAAAKPNTPTPPATVTAVNQAGERAQQAEDSLRALGQEVQGAEQYVRQQIVERMTPIAEQVRAERKADAVIQKGGTFASDPTRDITALIVQRLDAAFPTPSITPPAAPAAQAPAQQQPRPATQQPQGR
jgi:Skp family chaperone for outer membrane proteins